MRFSPELEIQQQRREEDFCQERLRFLVSLKSQGIIAAEEMPVDISDTEEEEDSAQLDGGGTAKLRQSNITNVLERVDDTGLVTDDDNDEEDIIDQVEQFMDDFVK